MTKSPTAATAPLHVLHARATGAALGRSTWLVVVAGLLTVGAALVLLMPPNPDAITGPAALVLNFRVRSLFGLTLFWAVFGVVFGWFAWRHAQPASSASAVATNK